MNSESMRYSQRMVETVAPGGIVTKSNPSPFTVASGSKTVLNPYYAVPNGQQWMEYMAGNFLNLPGVVVIDMGDISDRAYARLDLSMHGVDNSPDGKKAQEDIYGFRIHESPRLNSESGGGVAIVFEKLFTGLEYTFGTANPGIAFSPQTVGSAVRAARRVADPESLGTGRYLAGTGGMINIIPFPTPGTDGAPAGYTLYDRGPWRGIVRCCAKTASDAAAGHYPVHARWR